MKNKLWGIVSFFTICACTFVSTQTKSEPVSNLALDNIEALAQNEGGGTDCTVGWSGCYDGLWHPDQREIW